MKIQLLTGKFMEGVTIIIIKMSVLLTKKKLGNNYNMSTHL